MTGQRFSLDYTVYPSGARFYKRTAANTHQPKRVDDGPKTLTDERPDGNRYHPAFDDILTINTQGTTQWDSFLCHSYYGSG